MRLDFDLETNGLLEEVSRVHVLVIKDLDSGVVSRYRRNDNEDTIERGLTHLTKATELWGHNIQGYDLKVIEKLYPKKRVKITGKVFDTYILAELIWPEIKYSDFRQMNKMLSQGQEYKKKLIGRHSLEAWGQRLGFPKDDYKQRCLDAGIDPWTAWNQDMEEYCVIDTEVTCRLAELILAKNFGPESFDIEHRCRPIIQRQETFGFPFKEKEAVDLYGDLQTIKQRLYDELIKHFGSFYLPDGKKKREPKKTLNYKDKLRPDMTAGAIFTPVKLVEFNPGSRDHIGRCLIMRYGWEPVEFGNDGKPTVDEDTLKNLPYPPTETIIRYLTVNKRIGMLAEGKQAWLKKVHKDGRMHGRVHVNKCVTGRMSHSGPNMGQVQGVVTARDRETGIEGPVFGEEGGWGYEMRNLFHAPEGMVEVGIDASGLELRCLAHYMAIWDNGVYAKVILEGDIHSVNAEALGLEPTKMYTVAGKPLSGRALAKRFIYAYLYGAGDALVGSFFGKGPAFGKKKKLYFQRNLSALGKLIAKCQAKAKSIKKLKGIDGRWLECRAVHSALNTLLQGCGAIVMKKALIILDDRLQTAGLKPGVDYEFMANVHDEWQIASLPHIAEEVGNHGKEAIRQAGEYFNFRCPLDGEYKVGNSWAECH